MPPIDVRPAAQAEAERIWPSDREYTVAQTTAVFSVKELDAYCASAFTRGAHWAVGKLPTREEIAEAAHKADCGCTGGLEHDEPYFAQADAVLALIQKQYENCDC